MSSTKQINDLMQTDLEFQQEKHKLEQKYQQLLETSKAQIQVELAALNSKQKNLNQETLELVEEEIVSINLSEKKHFDSSLSSLTQLIKKNSKQYQKMVEKLLGSYIKIN